MADPYLTVAQLRETRALESEEKYSDSTLEDLVAEFEAIAEDYRGVAYTPREAVDTFRAPCRASLMLAWPFVREVTAVTVDGTTVDLDTLKIDLQLGLVREFSATFDTAVVVTYEHGFDAPPPLLLRACRQYVRSCALSDSSSVPRDVITQADGAGGYTRFSTPDKAAGRPTGWLEVDRLLNSLEDHRTP